MKFWATIALSVTGFGIATLGVIMPFYIEDIRPYAMYILWFGIFLTVGPWVAMLTYFLKNKKITKKHIAIAQGNDKQSAANEIQNLSVMIETYDSAIKNLTAEDHLSPPGSLSKAAKLMKKRNELITKRDVLLLQK